MRMSDVARKAGVATITVSRALRTPQRVSADVLARVQAAVATTGYVPNLAAGTLKSQRSRIVAVIVPTLRSSIFADTVEGLARGLDAHGYQLLIANSGYSIESEERILRNLLGRQPDAVVLTGTAHTAATRRMLQTRQIPVVETWDLTGEPIDRLVGFSNLEGSRQLTHALAARGYRRIAFVAAHEVERRSALRRAGYLQAMAELGFAPDVLEADHQDTPMAAGGRAVRELLRRTPRVQAACFLNDFIAFGALLECQRVGIPVPGELAIAGFGDFEIAAEAIPALSTVRVPGDRMGEEAARLIVDRLSGRPDPQKVVDLGFEVVMRESTPWSG
jgi:LacI family transcriptional regulator, gluconate utilization system Gnt-I transcriptional repressor